jgi:phosphoribosylamine--glycine ligase
MMTADGPKVLEFNVPLGDHGTQLLMHRMQSVFVPRPDGGRGRPRPCRASGVEARPERVRDPHLGQLPGLVPRRQSDSGIAVADATGATVFPAGTRAGANGIETSGGHVLGVTASGPDLRAATAYRAVEPIHFDGMHYRPDIGHKGLGRW